MVFIQQERVVVSNQSVAGQGASSESTSWREMFGHIVGNGITCSLSHLEGDLLLPVSSIYIYIYKSMWRLCIDGHAYERVHQHHSDTNFQNHSLAAPSLTEQEGNSASRITPTLHGPYHSGENSARFLRVLSTPRRSPELTNKHFSCHVSSTRTRRYRKEKMN